MQPAPQTPPEIRTQCYQELQEIVPLLDKLHGLNQQNKRKQLFILVFRSGTEMQED